MKNAILNWFLSISGIATVLGILFKKYGLKILKGVTIARDSLDLVDEVLQAVKPDADGNVKLTDEEIKEFEALALKLRKDLQ